MALPKLNDQPKYDLTIPSSGVEIRIRPFLVKEEKVLLLAMESQDQSQILSAIVDTLEACVLGDIDANALTTFDIEYLFTKLRTKSVGESAKIELSCTKCEAQNPVTVPMDDVGVKGDMNSQTAKVDLGSGISIDLQWPRYKTIANDKTVISGGAEATFSMIKHCISHVCTDDERIKFDEESAKERDDFVNSMTSENFGSIKTFIEAMPTLKHDIDFNCVECGHKNEFTLEGMQDFF
jgi:ribosomal protein L44E|tara:strand:- start:43621 stop:44331 length:711 start_codon:yes stop_codon:yes gene_type:complete